MLLCSENTASTVDSTQNKMILYHLSEKSVPTAEEKEGERAPAETAGVESAKVPGPDQQGEHCLLYGICHSTSSSPGEMPHVHHISLIPTIPGDAHQGTEQTPAAKGVLHPSLPTWEKQLAAARASGSSWGCQLLDPALCF